MTTSPLFWDKIAKGYAKRPVASVENYEDTLSRTRQFLSPDAQVLEIGCGTGTTALKLAPHLGQITATDFSEAMLSVARTRQAEAGAENVTFRCATADETWPEGAFDTVLAFNLLHLIEDIPGTLKSAHAALKPGGHFISKSFCLANAAWYMSPMIRVMQWIGKAPFLAVFRPDELEGMITRAGFEVVQTKTYGGTSHLVMARKI